MEKYDLPYNNKARRIERKDFDQFDYIFGMDPRNVDDLKRFKPENSKSKILMLGNFNRVGEKIILDPYCVSIY